MHVMLQNNKTKEDALSDHASRYEDTATGSVAERMQQAVEGKDSNQNKNNSKHGLVLTKPKMSALITSNAEKFPGTAYGSFAGDGNHRASIGEVSTKLTAISTVSQDNPNTSMLNADDEYAQFVDHQNGNSKEMRENLMRLKSIMKGRSVAVAQGGFEGDISKDVVKRRAVKPIQSRTYGEGFGTR